MNSTKLSEAIKLFWEKSLINNSPRSRMTYLLVLSRFEDEIGDFSISDVVNNAKNFENFFENIKDKYKLNDTSLFTASLYLRVFFNFLKNNDILDKAMDVDKMVNYEKYKNAYRERMHNLTPESLFPFEEEQIRIYWLFQEPTIVSLRNALLVNLVLETGVKSCILRGIQKESFNYEKKTLAVVIRKKLIKWKLSEETSTLAKNYLTLRQDSSTALFTNHSQKISGDNIINKTIERVVKQTIVGVGFDRIITPINLRYTFISKIIAKGLSSKKVEKLTGYKNRCNLSRFGIRDDSYNKAEKNLERHLNDFKKVAKLEKEWELSRRTIEKMLSSKKIESRIIRSQKYARESAIIDFVKKVREQYMGFIKIKQRATEWKINPERLVAYCMVNPSKGKKISRVWYINEQVSQDDIPPLNKKGRKKKNWTL